MSCKTIIIDHGCCNGDKDVTVGIGGNGWSPEFASIEDGARRVQQIVDWFGGEGDKPAVGQYIGLTGFVEDIGDAVDIRGPEGEQGVQGPKGDKGDQGPAGPAGIVDANDQIAAMLAWASAKLDTEYWTGKYHTDGKKVYGKKIFISSLPNNDVVAHEHKIDDVDEYVDIYGMTCGSYKAPLPSVRTTLTLQIGLRYNGNHSIYIETGNDRSSVSAIITMEYTCKNKE